MELSEETKAKIQRANMLFGEMVKARKANSAFHEKVQTEAKKMGELNKMLFEATEVTPDHIAAWKAQMAISVELHNDPPPTPDYKEWMHARDEAVDALAAEAELFLRPDAA